MDYVGCGINPLKTIEARSHQDILPSLDPTNKNWQRSVGLLTSLQLPELHEISLDAVMSRYIMNKGVEQLDPQQSLKQLMEQFIKDEKDLIAMAAWRCHANRSESTVTINNRVQELLYLINQTHQANQAQQIVAAMSRRIANNDQTQSETNRIFTKHQDRRN